MRYHDQCNLAICLTLSQPVYFTWQCDIRYHNQCISQHIARLHWSWYRITHCQVKYTGCGGIVWHIARLHWSGIVWHIARWNTLFVVPIRYHDQCLAPGNVSYGTTTSAFHLAMCHTGPRSVPFSWHYGIWYHDQCILHGNVSYGTTNSVFHLAMCHTMPDQCNLAICHNVSNNHFRLNVILLFFVWSLTTTLFNVMSIDNNDGHHIEGIC
jgi:hypothetical protein